MVIYVGRYTHQNDIICNLRSRAIFIAWFTAKTIRISHKTS